MGSLEIDIELIQKINQRLKIRTAGTITILVGLVLEIAFIIFLIISAGLSFNSNFFPLSLIIFSIILWFILYYLVFQIIDLKEAKESNYIGIKKRFFVKARKRSKRFTIVFIIIMLISVIVFLPLNSTGITERSLHQGDVIYFANSYNFGARTIKSIGFNGGGNIIIYQNGSSVPIYQVDVNGNILLNQSLADGYYELVVESGSVNVYIFYENSYVPLIITMLTSLLGIVIILSINSLISRNSRLIG